MTERKLTREQLQKERQQQKRKKQPKAKQWLKKIMMAVLIVGLVGFIGGASLFAYYAATAPDLDEELLKYPVSSEFYDKDGELFATIGKESRKYVKYEDIPEEMINAILATEDVRFFNHFGIDLWRLGGAVLANVRDGFGAQGASTITQQVVKNSFFKNEKKLKRKAQEAWLAIQLERQYSKEEIFEMYFNKVLMSGRIYGFGQAAEYFYGKTLDELTLDEMATLAGMPQSPNAYNPFKYPEAAEKRKNIVLSLMVQHKKITQAQADEAKKIAVADRVLPEDERKPANVTNYPAFLDVVLSELERNGDAEALAEGIKVYTTLDANAQKAVEAIMNNDSNFTTEKIQSGAAVIDTKTGEIQAVGGGRNYGVERGYNYAYDLVTRAPGSTMKPLLDYAPAIEYLKWSTGETLVDEPMNYTGTNQTITNWDNKYLGAMTARTALYTSRNIPAVKTLKAVGTEQAQNFVSRLGIDVDYVVESDAIGGGRINISPIQMAGAYAAFGNNGVYTAPHSINKIVYRDGTSTKKYKSEETVAMSDYTAYMVTDMLRDVVSNKPNASGTAAIVSGLDIAGKTGTTNYSADEFAKYNLPSSAVPDSWFAGYTTNYSIAIWSGYEKRQDAITSWDERRLPQTLFKSIMSEISKNVETARFSQPSSVVSATVEVGTSPLKLASEFTPDNLRMTELFVKGTEPQEISEEYQQLELEAPFNLQAIYNDTTNSIDLTWEHNVPTTDDEESISNIAYEVTMSIDGGEPTIISSSTATYATVQSIELGHNYTFTVSAVAEDVRSEPASTSLYIEDNVEVPDVDDDSNWWEPDNPEDPENPSTPDNGENNGQVTPPEQPTDPMNPPDTNVDGNSNNGQ